MSHTLILQKSARFCGPTFLASVIARDGVQQLARALDAAVLCGRKKISAHPTNFPHLSSSPPFFVHQKAFWTKAAPMAAKGGKGNPMASAPPISPSAHGYASGPSAGLLIVSQVSPVEYG